MREKSIGKHPNLLGIRILERLLRGWLKDYV